MTDPASRRSWKERLRADLRDTPDTPIDPHLDDADFELIAEHKVSFPDAEADEPGDVEGIRLYDHLQSCRHCRELALRMIEPVRDVVPPAAVISIDAFKNAQLPAARRLVHAQTAAQSTLPAEFYKRQDPHWSVPLPDGGMAEVVLSTDDGTRRVAVDVENPALRDQIVLCSFESPGATVEVWLILTASVVKGHYRGVARLKNDLSLPPKCVAVLLPVIGCRLNAEDVARTLTLTTETLDDDEQREVLVAWGTKRNLTEAHARTLVFRT
jgi:hypothetical protein